jgi:hypothetical protein
LSWRESDGDTKVKVAERTDEHGAAKCTTPQSRITDASAMGAVSGAAGPLPPSGSRRRSARSPPDPAGRLTADANQPH